jgi:NAD(P)-dependent dehydrogenase (short-subunit alcohol dehydrogenase family)
MTEVSHTRTAVVLGGTAGIGREVARALARRGEKVFLSGRELARAEDVASDIGGDTHPLAVDLAEPHDIAGALADVGVTDDLVIGGIHRDSNSVVDYRIDDAIRLVTLKLVGYIEAVHVLHERLTPRASIVLLGGLALERPYPGSTTVSTVNGGVTGVVHTLACELAPIRVNAIHPGIVGDSPFWAGKDTSQVVARTPLGRLVTMAEIVESVLFLLDCSGVNGVNLAVDGGWRLK